jgi:hypothetical protein
MPLPLHRLVLSQGQTPVRLGSIQGGNVIVDPTVLIPGILSKIRPRNCPNQSYVLCITDSGPRAGVGG